MILFLLLLLMGNITMSKAVAGNKDMCALHTFFVENLLKLFPCVLCAQKKKLLL